MKFLIFNVIVLCSLGYLLTSKPNENFNQWFSNTKDKISNLSKEEVVKNIKKIYFDRGKFKYHGRVKEFAETLRKNGMEF